MKDIILYAATLTLLLLIWCGSGLGAAPAFEGRISATLTRGGETQTLLYTVGTNQLRIERGEADRPYAKNLVARDTGAITLLFPNNRSFVRLKPVPAGVSPAGPGGVPPPGFPRGWPPGARTADAFPMDGRPGLLAAGTGAAPAVGLTNVPGTPAPPGMPQRPSLPPLPPGIGPQAQGATGGAPMPPLPPMPAPPSGLPPGIGPQAAGPGSGGALPNLSALPMRPMRPMEQMELKATKDTTNLLGYTCARYELKQRGEVMEIWATDKLLPFQPYLPNQRPRFGPRLMEEQWGGLLQSQRLFPLLAVLRFEAARAPDGRPPVAGPPVAGPERMRFEVKSIKPERIADQDGSLFEPPPDYHELEPLPF